MVVVDLPEACGHFPAAGCCSGDEDEILGQRDMIIMTEAVLAKDDIGIVGIAVDLVSFPYPVLFPLEFLFEFQDNIEHIANVDVVDDNMWLDSDVFLDDPDHLINVVLVIDIFVAQLPIGEDVIGVDAEEDLSLALQGREDILLRFRIESWQDSCGMCIIHEFPSYLEI